MPCFTGKQSTSLKGVADLLVQLITVGKNNKRRTTGKLATNLLCKENHRITLTAALGVPEHTQLAVFQFSRLVRFYCLINTKILMVAGEYLCCSATRMVEENEILKQVHKVVLIADTKKHGFKVNRANLILF